MNKSLKRLIPIGTLMTTLLLANSAFAVDFASPFGAGVAVEVRVGGEFFGNQWIVWKRRDNGACLTTQIGGLFGLTQNTTVLGSNLDDVIVVQKAIEVHCGRTLGTPLGNGMALELKGQNGNDALFGTFPTTLVNGGNGNDTVLGDGPSARLIGELGNDDVESWGTGNQELLLGDGFVGGPSDGNDCIYDKSQSANSVNCSGGTADKIVLPLTISPGGHGPGASCEQVVTCCNWAHFVGQC
jgi:Ca2+-binding RTX toxin-like protein